MLQVEAARFERTDQWTADLERIAGQPLALCEDFPAIAARHEAWWNHGLIDRPVFIAHGGRGGPAPHGKCIELMNEPAKWLEARRQQLANQQPIGDGLPHIRVDLGPAALGPMLGGRVDVSPNTVWTHPHIDDDYANAPTGGLHDDAPFTRYFRECLEVLAADAAGRYLVMSPDIGGCGDTLTNLRGPDNLSMDMIDQPDRAIAALEGMYPAWRQAFETLYDTAVARHEAGVITWLGLWSNRPYTVTNCDFNALIGPREFEQVFLPEIDRIARSAGRSVFHLDGPDAARHADALAELDSLDAIQFTPGAAAPGALAHAPMLKRLQAAGKCIIPFTPVDEVLPLIDALSPEGLAMIVVGPADRVRQVLAEVNERFGLS